MRGILHDRSFTIVGTFSLAIYVCLIGVSKCISNDAIDEAEGSTGETDIASWTSWSLWSKCSESCGGGLSNRTRHCTSLTDLETKLAVTSCSGHATEVRVCNRQICLSGSRRQSYCLPLMNRFFHGKRYYWEAFIDPRRPCKAMCHTRSGNFYVPTGDTVPDGTLCDDTGNDVCILGTCHKVGCDDIIGSTAKIDLCGVCNGQEKSCRVVRSNFTVDASLMKYGYNRIMTVPKGAFNINITELESSRNYLAMKTKSGYSILNSHWRLSHYGHKYVLGTVMDYQRRTNISCPAQCVFIVGPINDDIHVQLLFYRDSSRFTYQFSTPLDMNGGQNYVYDIIGEPSGKTHHHRPHHQSNDNQKHHHRRPHERQHSHDQSSSAAVPHRNSHMRHGSKKRRFQYNESFMTPHRSEHHQSDSEPTHASPRRTQATRNVRKSYISPTIRSMERNTPSFDRKNQRRNNRHKNRNNYGNGNHYQPSATSLYYRSHRIPNRRISSEWPTSSTEQSQPVRHGSSVILGEPSPTIIIANSRFSSDRIKERQQPIRVENGNRHLQPDRDTSQLSLGSNPLNPSGQKIYQHTGAQLPGELDSSKSGSNFAGANTGYSWRISGFTECSETCGGGIEETIVVCVKENSQVVVTDENCEHTQKPGPKTVSCNLTPCPAEWFTGPWSECSTTCGPGTQTRQVTCQQRISPVLNLTVSAEACRGQVRNQTNRTCSLQPCFFWKVANWSQCSSTCGKGMRVRAVTCMNIEGHPAEESMCQEIKPIKEELCDMGSCATGWFFTDWPQKCPVECGEGIMRRNLHCAADNNTTLPDERCSKFPRPRLENRCKVDVPCGGKWFLGLWSKCNATCGEGMKNRDVVCIKQLSGSVLMVVDENNCAMEEKPETVLPCQREPCPPQWYMMNWSKCSKSCDLGHRTREVKCLDNQRKPNLACNIRIKPSTRESCNLQSCGMTTAAPVSGCSDLLGQCHLVVRARLCSYHYYHRICCASCTVANEREVGNNGASLATTAATVTPAYSTTPSYPTTSYVSPTETTLFANFTNMTLAEEHTVTTPNTESTDSQS